MSTQPKCLLSDFGLATGRQIIYANLIFSSTHIGKNELIKHFSVVFLLVWSYGWTTQHSPGTNRNIWVI